MAFNQANHSEGITPVVPTTAPKPRQPISARGTTYHHVILTRFNVRYNDSLNTHSIGVDHQWLEYRFALFEKYCLPAIATQSNQDFSWVLFFDELTPNAFLERANAWAMAAPQITIAHCTTLPLSLVKTIIHSLFALPSEWLITTRLDNDDGVSPDFIEMIQQGASFTQPEVLNFPSGIIYANNKTYARQDRSNAFITLVERYSNFNTVFSILRHVYAGESYPIRQLTAQPMWLQVVHDSNISNRVRGWRVDNSVLSHRFPAMALKQREVKENRSDIVFENLVDFFPRSIRDSLITFVRVIAHKIGIDLRRRVKER